MFDVPSAKRIRRDEVLSPSSSRSASPAPESDLQDAHARLGKLLDLDGLFGTESAPRLEDESGKPPVIGNNDDEEQEFEFRLFSAPAKPKTGTDSTDTQQKKKKTTVTEGPPSGDTQKLRIRLRSPTPVTGDPSQGRFVKSFRGWQYYFSSPSLYEPGKEKIQFEHADRITEKKRQFEDMAVSGQHMETWAKSQAWVSAFPPAAIFLGESSILNAIRPSYPPAAKDVPVYVVKDALLPTTPTSCKKPGKKRRVQLRKRAAVAQAAQETEAEKRNRKNRERKIKRRQKAREQKAAATSGDGAGDVTMADGDDASSDS